MGKIKSIRKNKESDGKLDTNKTNDATNRIMKFTFQTLADQAKYHTFATIKDHIANQIQRDYEDRKYLAKAIQNGELKMYERPSCKRSVLEDENKRSFQQETFNHDYKIDVTKYEKKVENLQDNMASSYVLIFDDYCTKDLQ